LGIFAELQQSGVPMGHILFPRTLLTIRVGLAEPAISCPAGTNPVLAVGCKDLIVSSQNRGKSHAPKNTLSLAILARGFWPFLLDHSKNNVKQALAKTVQANTNMRAPRHSRLASWHPEVHKRTICHCQKRLEARVLS
jgi:hypothetical protein